MGDHIIFPKQHSTMHAVAFGTPSTSATVDSRSPKRTIRRQSLRVVARAAECKPDAAVVSPVLSRSRREVLFTGLAAFWAGTTPRADAATPPPTPDASNSAYIQSLLAKTEANKDRCVARSFLCDKDPLLSLSSSSAHTRIVHVKLSSIPFLLPRLTILPLSLAWYCLSTQESDRAAEQVLFEAIADGHRGLRGAARG